MVESDSDDGGDGGDSVIEQRRDKLETRYRVWMKTQFKEAPISESLKSAGFRWIVGRDKPRSRSAVLDKVDQPEAEIEGEAGALGCHVRSSHKWKMSYLLDNANGAEYLLRASKLPRTREGYHAYLYAVLTFDANCESCKDVTPLQAVVSTLEKILAMFPSTFALFLSEHCVEVNCEKRTVRFRIDFVTASDEHLHCVTHTRFWI
jgi:hypothetical protein